MSTNHLKNINIEQHYNTLRAIYGEDPSGEAIASKITTRGDRQRDGCLELLETSARLKDATPVLESCIDTLADLRASNTSKKNARNVLKSTISPLLSLAADTARDVAKTTAPFAGMSYVHMAEEQKKKKRARESVVDSSVPAGKKSPEMFLLNEFVASKKVPSSGRPSPRTVTPAAKVAPPRASKSRAKHRLQRGLLPLSIVASPPSCGTKYYSIPEFIKLVNKYPPRSAERSRMMDVLLDKSREFHVQFSRASAFRYLTQAAEGREFAGDDYGAPVGRPPILSQAELDEVAKDMTSKLGSKQWKDEMNSALIKSHKKKALAKGVLPNPPAKWNKMTIMNYLAVIASRPNVHLVKNSIVKSESRNVAENSLIGSMALIMQVAAHHFYVVEEDDVAYRNMFKNFSEDAKLFHTLVSIGHGDKPVRARSPHDILNQDDTTLFICVGLQPNKCSEWALVTSASLNNRKSYSIHEVENSNKMNGLRIKIHFLTNAAGHVADICISVSGLTDRDMPNDDFIPMKIQGLGINGAGVSYDSNVYGYVLLIKSSEGAERK